MPFKSRLAFFVVNTRYALLTFLGYVTSNAVTKEKWDLLAAVCLERKPVITPPPNELEEKFQKFLSDLEFERSLKSDHEKRHEVELYVDLGVAGYVKFKHILF